MERHPDLNVVAGPTTNTILTRATSEAGGDFVPAL
jgi:hypothetical protein